MTAGCHRRFCTALFGAELATRVVSLARPGFELTRAAPKDAAGNSRFGGHPMLEPGTPWPTCEGVPLSLFAVLDTDALTPWLDGLIPAGAGLLNFFYLDSESELCDPAAVEVASGSFCDDQELGAVIAARSGHAVETDPPARSSVFTPIPWAASPGFAFPDTYDPAWGTLWAEPDVYDEDIECVRDYASISNLDPDNDWVSRPGHIIAENLAFGWPIFPTGGSPTRRNGEDPNLYHHLLQLSDQDEWRIGGDGGWMHWSIPTEALRSGDFSQAIPTPDIW
ncbi:hypothetical protein SPAR_29871 [Streptomyces sparsogenes DSM 40356]|uniref:DUF1963 domain-containing protein n=2 Tax=Streptomyces sparsogenes TaxID=67365 RepID=A0A1R1SBS5_9ACTN|nr:hypothetical protein SPAR_29871 [Streptomyces sparsogenes DSM 40356]